MRTVAVELVAKIQNLKDGMQQGKKAISDFGDEVKQAKDKHPRALADISDSAIVMGGAMVAAFGGIVRSTMEFDKSMSTVQGATKASGAEMDKLRDLAIKAGEATKFSASEAADAEAELAKAGVATADILSGALSGSLSLAAAGSLGLADAATTAAQAMNIFNLGGQDVGHIADVLAAGANKSAADVGTLSAALRQGGLVASNTGLTLEDTVGTLSAFADSALIGSDAGTSLKTMLQALANPSKESAALMRELGLNAYDTSGKFVGVANFAQQLKEKLGDLTQAERDQAMAQIFGADATRAATVLYKQGAAGLKDYIEAVDDIGAAQDMASTKMNNLSGDVENLRGSLETLAIRGGSGVSEGLRNITQSATRLVNAVGQIPGGVTEVGVTMLGIGGAALLFTGLMGRAQVKVAELSASLAAMGPMGARAGAALTSVAGFASKALAAIAVLQVASAALGKDVNPSVNATVNSLEKLGKSGERTGDTLRHLDYDVNIFATGAVPKFANGTAKLIEGVTGLGSVMDESAYHAKQRMEALDNALAQMVQSGKTEEAAKAFDQVAEAVKKQGGTIEEARKGLPQYAAALDDAAKRVDVAATMTNRETKNVQTLNKTLEEAIAKTGSFKDTFDQLNSVMLESLDASVDAEEAIDNFTESLKDNGKTFDIHEDKGRKNVKALEAIIKAARDAADATLKQTGSVQKASETYNSYTAQAIAAAGNDQKLRYEVERLIATYGNLPSLKQTTVTAPGLEKAQGDMWGYSQAIHNVPGNVNSYVHISVADALASIQRVRDALGSLNAQVGAGMSAAYADYYYKKSAGMARGGIVAAASGLLTNADIFAGGKRPLTVSFAEGETGQEAFIPMYGDLNRSRAIADHVVRKWLGGQTSWGGQQQQTSVSNSTTNYNMYGTSEELVSALSARQRVNEVRQRVGRL